MEDVAKLHDAHNTLFWKQMRNIRRFEQTNKKIGLTAFLAVLVLMSTAAALVDKLSPEALLAVVFGGPLTVLVVRVSAAIVLNGRFKKADREIEAKKQELQAKINKATVARPASEPPGIVAFHLTFENPRRRKRTRVVTRYYKAPGYSYDWYWP